MKTLHADLPFWPLESGAIPTDAVRGGVAVLNASRGSALDGLKAGGANIVCIQPFRPGAAALESAGYVVVPYWAALPDVGFAAVAGTGQQDETTALIARAMRALDMGGWISCAAPRDAGGRRLGSMLRDLGLDPFEDGRRHARIVWAAVPPADERDADLRERLDARETAGRARPVSATGYAACPGLFSWNDKDLGTSILLQHIPDDLGAHVADFGCGYGFLCCEILKSNRSIKTLHYVDADSRAVECCTRNLDALGLSGVALHPHWADIAAPGFGLKGLDAVMMNPPFHKGRALDIGVGLAFIRAAAASLKPGGKLFMVANSGLPYEPELVQHFCAVEKRAETRGFKVFCAEKKK